MEVKHSTKRGSSRIDECMDGIYGEVYPSYIDLRVGYHHRKDRE
jgi:hypothetical protein